MPEVEGKHYAYNKAGIAAAKKHAARIGNTSNKRYAARHNSHSDKVKDIKNNLLNNKKGR